MAYPGVKLFMEKLKQMIYSNDIPQISNDPSILSKRPQLQLLYEELGSMIQTLFVDTENDPHELEEVRKLKKRFKDVAEKAHDVVDLFVYDVNYKSKIRLNSHASKTSLYLEDVMRSIKSIKRDFFSIIQKVKMESSPTTDSLKTQSAASVGTSCFRNSPVGDEIVVGLDRDIEIIRDKLTEDTRKLDVVSIVGMGGSGKTTLATKVFNDPFVVHHFWVRGWVTVSQKFERKDLLNRLLAYMGVDIDPDTRDNYPQLRKKLHQHLMGQRYIVVIDDIWSTQAWDDLKVVFPNPDNGSRILLTSRHKTVALHANSLGFIHQLRSLTDEESLELLRKKVFRGDHFPNWSSLLGMKIARKCRGLPLSVVVIAGVLAKESATKKSWERISQSGSSLILNNLKGQMQTFALSLNHLPSHLRNCFIYLGCFPEDYTFRVTRLIWLWIAEGFIQEARNRSLEETAKDYLMELVDRSLIVVQGRKIDGAIKTISVHDALRELCLEVARKENSCLKVQGVDHSAIAPYKTRRIFTDCYIDTTHATRIQSLLNFYSDRNASYVISESSHSWKLLKVLDLKQCPMTAFPMEISLLVNLRYLAVQYNYKGFFQSRICDLWSLETLIIEGTSHNPLGLPNTISDLVNLRNLLCRRTIVFPPLQTPMMNLRTISNVALTKNWEKYFPNVKKLSCYIFLDTKYDFESLTFLEILKISSIRLKKFSCSRFPASLKKLTLQGCRLPWSCISTIQSLPNLEVLKLLKNSFMGRMWDAGEEPFQQLKFLKLVGLDIIKWEASEINFPCLKKLFLENCHLLEGIPLEMKDVPTLEHIQIENCNSSVITSANEIRKEQHDYGNSVLMIRADRRSLLRYVAGGVERNYRKEIENGNFLWEFFDRLERGTPLLVTGWREERSSFDLDFSVVVKSVVVRGRSNTTFYWGLHLWNDGNSNHGGIERRILKGGRRVSSFLKKLFLKNCHLLERIPFEIKRFSILEHTQIESCNSSVIKSAVEAWPVVSDYDDSDLESCDSEQHTDGNYDQMTRADGTSLARDVIGGKTTMATVPESKVRVRPVRNSFQNPWLRLPWSEVIDDPQISFGSVTFVPSYSRTPPWSNQTENSKSRWKNQFVYVKYR